MGIKAIETIYSGYRFRSRLEARWAVFFDALGIEYRYEHEGYETPHGFYLPDFWLPETETYIEIKPAEYTPQGKIKCPDFDPRWEYLDYRFCMGYWSCRLVVICGTPGPNSYDGFIPGDLSYRWGECPECGCVDIQYLGRVERNRNHKPDCSIQNVKKAYYPDTSRILNAYNIARQARFEHGKCG